MTRFAVATVFGALLSLSISLGLIPLIAAVLVALVPPVAWRSGAALSGALIGWGATWVVLGGRTYVHCLSMGPDCGGSEGILAFVLIGAAVLLLGLAVGWFTLRRTKPTPEANPRS